MYGKICIVDKIMVVATYAIRKFNMNSYDYSAAAKRVLLKMFSVILTRLYEYELFKYVIHSQQRQQGASTTKEIRLLEWNYTHTHTHTRDYG